MADHSAHSRCRVHTSLNPTPTLVKKRTCQEKASESATTSRYHSPDSPAVLLAEHARAHDCKLTGLPDRRCSPGAYYNKLTKKVICSDSFRTSLIRHVTLGEKHEVEQEYGLTPKSYGRTLEIDHIVSLELGGSNDIANLYPEEATYPDGSPGYHTKDQLENKLHDLVCSGEMALYRARQQIAEDWQALYTKVYGHSPTG